jgi:acyl carrier protein
MDTDALHARLVALVLESGDGNFSEQDLAAANGSLRMLNYSSLSYMRLIDAIENELGVYLDPEADNALFENIDSLTDLIRRGTDQVDV